ncbi:MAG: crotonobetainyl-CoA:carnitine CoA-transferase CaiB-like acyl-CoA transferase, partial [Arenicella sp.]
MASYLSSLKVIEISSVLAGPAVGLYFAEKGAEVIKIENSKTGGDVTRGWKLANEDSSKNTSAYFASVNWRKEHVFLDLSDDNDRSKIKALVTKADIVLTNFKKGDAEKFELDFLSLRTLNSNVILGEISGYGSKSERVAFDLVLQADTGFMSMNGTSDSGPVKMPVAFIDLFAAHQLKEGILEALLERNATGKAYHVKVSLFDAALASLANQATNYLIAGHVAQPMGSKHPNIAPYGELFKTKDERLITFAIGS